MRIIILIGILTSFISCKNNELVYNIDQEMGTSSEKKDSVKKFIWTETKVTINEDCELEDFLKNRKVPKLAKDLFKNKAKNDDRALEYFEKLKSEDKNEQKFYFKVITNLYKVADGTTGEGLGHSGLSYIEENTLDFLNYFDNKECFNEDDLKTWVGIVMIEFSLEYDNENNPNIVNSYISKLNQDSGKYNPSQKQTLKKFNDFLNEEWKIRLSKQ